MADINKIRGEYFAWDPHNDSEFAPQIYGSGTIGGKGRSLLFALRKLRDSGDPQLMETKVPESIYFGISLFHDFLLGVPNFETLLANDDPDRLEQAFLSAPVPPLITKALGKFLKEMTDPVVVRSSSRLEDSLKHSFAGKYLSTFLSNSESSLEYRVAKVEREIKKIYARTYFPQAQSYRAKHNLGDDDMGIIVIRMSGRWHGEFYYPTVGGVAYSRNFRRWNTRVKQEDGVLRIVFGLGTMSTKRGYARTISLTNPNLRPEGHNPDKVAFHAQELFHVIDRSNPDDLTQLDIKEKWHHLLQNHPDFAAYAQVYHNDGVSGYFTSLTYDMRSLEPNSKVCLTFEDFPKKYPAFFTRMKKTLSLLEDAMGVPADLEFAYNPSDDRLCLIQARPFWCSTCSESSMPDLDGQRVILQANRMVTPGAVKNVQNIVYVDHDMYYANPDFYGVARVVGEINKELGEPYIFVSPGRVGSSNPELGVPVQYNELTNCVCIVELGIPRLHFMPELSYGTHFFADLEVDNVLYMPVFSGEKNNIIDEEWFTKRAYDTSKHPSVRVYKGSFSAYMNGDTNSGIIIEEDK